MSGPAFTPAGADGGPPDPTKRVRYVEGMVLGVDDFQQDHAYLAGLGRTALRLGVGTGVVAGLRVSAAAVAGPPATVEARVAPGLLVDAAGRLVRVPEEQCADLPAWFATLKADDVKAKVVNPDAAGLKATLPARVTLAYAEVETDVRPVPGEPCRGDDRLTAATRHRDDFRLDLALDAPPVPRLAEALRQYAGWAGYALAFTEAALTPPANGDAKVNETVKLLTDSAAAVPAGADRVLPDALGALTAVKLSPGDRELARRCLAAAAEVFTADLLPKFAGPLLEKDVEAPGESPRPVLLGTLSLAVTRAANTDPWGLDAAVVPPASMRGRPVALGGLLPGTV